MQAARGTSLNPSDHDPDPEEHRRRSTWWLFAVVGTAAYALDIGTKQWALTALAERDIPVVGDFLVLHLTHNPGAAFSTGTQFTEVLTALAIIAVCVVLFLSRRLASPLWSVGLGLLIGGVGGNLTDRLVREPGVLRGHVIDWLMLPNWPVFNIADMCIMTAAGVIILQSLRGITLSGDRVEDEE
ncbi:signal peptidase II [Nocardioides piscis]|uniref:Lipoprotein signal peptidase n=1 Tax=Nocardioides piscis TaxID=2714938 RepID=A0A6G7YJ98_9ACTN|nr:signal peptidase II [Nocardioides piscis]QIK76815.1 signal peptidase II [Nocardioides piscis]